MLCGLNCLEEYPAGWNATPAFLLYTPEPFVGSWAPFKPRSVAVRHQVDIGLGFLSSAMRTPHRALGRASIYKTKEDLSGSEAGRVSCS